MRFRLPALRYNHARHKVPGIPLDRDAAHRLSRSIGAKGAPAIECEGTYHAALSVGMGAMPPMPEKDKIAHTSRAAFAALARRYEADLMRATHRMCRGDHDRAADLVQETLVRAYEATLAGTTIHPGQARAYFLRILTNLFINDYRRRRKWDANVDVDTLTSGGAAGPSVTHAAPADVPGTTLLANTLDEELEMALAMLSEPLRLCVVLVDMQGLEYAEAAAALGIPIGTVRSRLSRARMQLQDLLQGFARRRGLI